MRTPSRPFRTSRLALALACALAPQAASAVTYVVTNANASGTGSLAEAVNSANLACNTDPSPQIHFNIPGTGPFTIQPAGQLSMNCSPGPYNPLIDGYTQPGASVNTLPNGWNASLKIIIDGTALPALAGCGLFFGGPSGSKLTVRGLDIRNVNQSGFPQGGVCGAVDARGNRFFNNWHGANVVNPGRVGGLLDDERNVISASGASGVYVSFGGHVEIQNNFIGTNDSGTAPSPNVKGIWLDGLPSGLVEKNVIAGNSIYGIYVEGSTGNLIRFNKIGEGVGGGALANGDSGVLISNSSNIALQNNTIANNSGHGIQVVGASAIGNTFTANSVHSNVGKSIDLDFYGGPLPNDPGDADTGPNDRQNHAVITAVTQDATDTHVSWSLNSTPSSDFNLHFYSSPGAGPPGGRTYLQSSGTGTTDGSGNKSGVMTLFGLKNFISLTTTSVANGSTSEYSAIVALSPVPGVTVAPNPLTFPNVEVGASSGPQSITLTSTGTANYVINTFDTSSFCYGGPICSTGAFICANNCVTGGPGYAPSASCTIDVTFSPTTLGTHSTAFYICDNAAGSPRPVTVSGTAVAAPPPTLTPSSHDFGPVVVGGFSTVQTFTLSNPAASPLPITSFTVTGPFSLVSSTCSTSVPPAGSCSGDVKFVPTALGPATGVLSIGAGPSTLTSSLAGTGVAPAALGISPPAHDFGTVLVGATSAHSFTISNAGTSPAALTGPTVTGPFQITSTTCGAILAASANCIANVRFVPVTHGNASGSLSVASSGGTTSATLIGTGLSQPVLEMTSAPIDLGTTILGGAPLTLPVSLRNAGNAALTIDRIAVGAPFTLDNGCPLNLLPGESCVVTLGFNATEVGTFSGALAVVTNAPGGSRSIPVRAQVQARPEPVLRVTPATIGFGERMAGTQSPAQRITVTNEGGLDANGLALSLDSTHFLILNTTCGNVLAPQATCFADTAFLPTGFGPKRATLAVTSSNAPAASIGLSGAGCRPPPPNQGRVTRLTCSP